MNLGLRYAPTTVTKLDRHKLYNLLNPPFGLFTEVNQLTGGNASLRNWDPRVGLAWDPTGQQRMSIRSSFAIFHSPIVSRDNIPWFMPPAVQATQTAAQGLTYPFPFTNIPVGSGLVIPTDGTLTILQTGTNYGLRKTPYQMQWNLSVERELFSEGVLNVGYLGSRGVHLFVLRDFNSPVPFVGTTGRRTFGVFNPASNSVIANPRLNPLYAALNLADAESDSSYHALQTSFTKRFSRRWQSQVSYTWSKSIDNGSGSYGLDGGGTTTDPFDISVNRGLSTFDSRHNFRASGIYELPFTATGAVGKLVGGWSITGIYRQLSGSPFSPGAATSSTHNSSGSSQSRPDLVAGCKLYPDVQTRLNWFNPACYVMQALGTYGNAARDSLIGPGLWNLDISLLKDTRLKEQLTLQFRAEAFNILNHPNFGNPASQIFSSLAGARQANAGQITSTTTDPRQIQLALKILF